MHARRSTKNLSRFSSLHGVSEKESTLSHDEDTDEHSHDSKDRNHTGLKDSPDSEKAQAVEEVPQKVVIPTTVWPLYKERMVLLKIGDNYLRVGNGNKPIVGKLKPPMANPVNTADEDEGLLVRRIPRKAFLENFSYQDFTFFADETATIAQSWYNLARGFFHIRLAIQRPSQDNTPASRSAKNKDTNTEAQGPREYLCLINGPSKNQFELKYDRLVYGAWWKLTAVGGADRFVAESVQFPGRCLIHGRFGLDVSEPLSNWDRKLIGKGVWDKNRSLTIITLPDVAVWHPGVYVN